MSQAEPISEQLVQAFMCSPAEVREAYRRLGGEVPAVEARRGGLTRCQRDALVYCHDYHQKNGITPSFEELREYLGLRSKSGVHRLLSGLEERGFIRRKPHLARSIELVAGAF